jgi:hypothetical protein
MPGAFEISATVAVGRAIDDLLLLVECSFDGEWEGQVRYLPFLHSRIMTKVFIAGSRRLSRLRRSDPHDLREDVSASSIIPAQASSTIWQRTKLWKQKSARR